MDDRTSAAAAQVHEQIEELIHRTNAKAVFGEPIHQGEVTLIPVASVAYGFGTGQGWGREPKEGDSSATDTGAAERQQGGYGAGGGGGGLARPLGFIRISPDGAKWEPTMDMTRVAMAGMFLAGWIVYWGTKVARAGIKLAEMEAKAKAG